MRNILKFQRKNSEYKYTNYQKEWVSEQGVHYVCYPFMIYKDHTDYKLTHMSSGALICSSTYLHSAKYIATRLLPLPQWLLPTNELVKHMTKEQVKFCTNIIERYRNETKGEVSKLDKNCPFSI